MPLRWMAAEGGDAADYSVLWRSVRTIVILQYKEQIIRTASCYFHRAIKGFNYNHARFRRTFHLLNIVSVFARLLFIALLMHIQYLREELKIITKFLWLSGGEATTYELCLMRLPGNACSSWLSHGTSKDEV
jgi:hypothetical protein